MNGMLAAVVFVPMACGPVSYVIGRKSKKGRDAFVLAVTILEMLLTLLIMKAGEISLSIPGFAGLGIGFASGHFRTVMAFLTASGWLAATLLSREYFAHVKRRNRYYVFWLLTLGAVMGVFLSVDLYTTFIFFEIMSFTSYVAVVQTEEEDALKASVTYLAVAVIGGLVTLSGIFVLYHTLGTLNISELAHAAEAMEDKSILWVCGLLILVGFGAKAGAFPLHIWLPTAHPAAPAPASAVLSGVITKTGIYGVAVLSTTLFLHDAQWGQMLAVFGAITMVLGAALAVCSVDLKRTLACSSVSQIGFVVVGISMQCLLGHHNALAVEGTILHIMNHSLIKMVLFPCAGVIHLSTHSYDLNDIRGFGRGKPLLAVIMGIPMLSLAGLPFLNGYVSKTLLHESIVEYIHIAGEQAWLYSVLEWMFLFAGGLTFAYMLKLFCCIFVEKNEHPHWKTGKYIARTSAVVLLLYVAIMPVLGALPHETMEGVSAFARSFFHGEAPAHAVHYFAWINLKGAVISLTIGALVYLLIVRRMLIRKDRYIDPIPKWCSIEYGIYRPLIDLLSKTFQLIAGCLDRSVLLLIDLLSKAIQLIAVCLDQVIFRILFREIPVAAARGCGRLKTQIVQMIVSLTGREYTPRPSLEEIPYDYHFAKYEDDPVPEEGIWQSFGFGLMLAGLGLVFALAFIILHK